MREIFEDAVMRVALEIMDEEDPMTHAPNPDVSAHFAHIQFGQQTGYAIFNQRLRLLAIRLEIPQSLPPPTYPDEPPAED
jgi:hypothetical protein